MRTTPWHSEANRTTGADLPPVSHVEVLAWRSAVYQHKPCGGTDEETAPEPSANLSNRRAVPSRSPVPPRTRPALLAPGIIRAKPPGWLPIWRPILPRGSFALRTEPDLVMSPCSHPSSNEIGYSLIHLPANAIAATVASEMPPPRRALPRRHSTMAFLLIAAAMTFTVGCTSGQRDASDYDGTEEAFLDGCVSIAASDNEKIGVEGSDSGSKTQISSPSTYCGCVFDEIRASVPFADFKEINSTLRDEGGALPEGFRDAYAACDPSAVG